MQKITVIDPDDLNLQVRVQRAFWMKLQINDVLSPKSPYRFLAINVLEAAKEKGYDVNKLEAACKRFESSQQFGDRIETSKFFDNDNEELHSVSWKNEQFLKNSSLLFDAYRVDEIELPQWRIHDGKKLKGLECVVWAGKSQLGVPLQPEKPTSEPFDRDKILNGYVAEIARLHGKILEKDEQCESQKREISNLKYQINEQAQTIQWQLETIEKLQLEVLYDPEMVEMEENL